MTMTANSHWGLPVNAKQVPRALRLQSRWITWAAVANNGKFDKVPKRYDSHTGASVSDPNDWGPFDQAFATYERVSLLAGIGFVMTGVASLIAVDLDHCFDEKDQLTPLALDIVTRLQGYWERSPSGQGLRGFFHGELPGPSFLNRKQGVEMYGGGSPRYLTVTGHRMPFAKHEVTDADAKELETLYARYSVGSGSTRGDAAPMPPPPTIEEAKAAAKDLWGKVPDKFQRFLKTGDYPGYDSHSECVYGLVLALLERGVDDAQVFYALTHWNITWGYACRHRGDDYDKAYHFLWDEVCSARARTPRISAEEMGELFGDEGDAPSHAQGTNGTDGRIAHSPNSAQDEFPTPEERKRPKGPFRMSAWKGVPVEDVEWIVEDWIPRAEVTLYTGHGGLGKSLSMQQLQTALALGVPWFGLRIPKKMTSVGIYCEDSEKTLHRRQHSIKEWYMTDYEWLENAVVETRKGKNANYLAVYERTGEPSLTAFYDHVIKLCTQAKPDVLILDTVADMFAGNENDRTQVRNFVHVVDGIAQKFDCAVILCGHPSKSGLVTGDGSSGSTAWNNSVRFRMYLEREFDDKQPTPFVTLSKKKANYGSAIGEVRLMYSPTHHVLATVAEVPDDWSTSDDQEADNLFLKSLADFITTDRGVSTKRQGSYAPKIFAERLTLGQPDSTDSDTKRLITRLEKAMHRLLDKGVIEETYNRRDRIYRLIITNNGDNT